MMKKLMTAFAVCALTGAVFAQIESQNIVGYKNETYPVYRGQPMQFVKVGGGTTYITDILDMSTVEAFADELQIYDAANGVLITYQWNDVDETWFNASDDEPIDIEVIPGNAFMVLASGTWTFAGQVPSITTYDHPIAPAVYTFVGNAFPANATLAGFDWSGIEQFTDELQLYEAGSGVFVTYIMNDDNEWMNATSEEVLPSNTALNDGFLLLTDLSSIRQTLETN